MTVYRLTKRINCDQGAVRAVRFAVDGDYCMTAGANKTVKLRNPFTDKVLNVYSGHGNEVLDTRSSCDNGHILTCGADKAVLLWEVNSAKIVRNFRGAHAGPVNCVCFNEDSTVAVSGSTDATVKCWEVATPPFTRRFRCLEFIRCPFTTFGIYCSMLCN